MRAGSSSLDLGRGLGFRVHHTETGASSTLREAIPADAFAAAALCDESGSLPRADDAACDACFRLATEAGGTYVVLAC